MEIGPNSVYLPLEALSSRPSSGTRNLMTRDPSRDEAKLNTGRNSGEMSSRPQRGSGKACGTTESLGRNSRQHVG